LEEKPHNEAIARGQINARKVGEKKGKKCGSMGKKQKKSNREQKTTGGRKGKNKIRSGMPQSKPRAKKKEMGRGSLCFAHKKCQKTDAKC